MSDRTNSFSNFISGLFTGDEGMVVKDYWFRVHALAQVFSAIYQAELAEEVGDGWWRFQHPKLGMLEWNFPNFCPIEAPMPFFKVDGVPLLEFKRSEDPMDLLTHVKWVAPAAEDHLPAETRKAVEKWLGCLEMAPPMR